MKLQEQISLINRLKDYLLKQDDTQESAKWSTIIRSLMAGEELYNKMAEVQEDCVDIDRSELIDMINNARMKYKKDTK